MVDEDYIDEIRKEREKWDKNVGEALKKYRERKTEFQTQSNITMKRLYTPEDIISDGNNSIGFPGEWPYTRGTQATMYRGKLWTMRQYAGFGTAEETNTRFKYLIEHGLTGLSVAFDLPTQLGYDSDDPMAEGEVGRVGVAVDTVEDMERVFNGIPLDLVTTSMTINSPAIILLAMYIATGEKQGYAPEKLSGTIQNDILKEYIARGTYIFPVRASMRLTLDIFSFCLQNMPKWNVISVSGYHMREAGATAIQEIAFTIANAIEYLKAGKEIGIDIEKLTQRTTFFFSSHNNFLEEIAKFRAARRVWAKVLRENFGVKDAGGMKFHTQTAGCTLTAQQPEINIVRVTMQALASVLGGTQSLHTNSMDEALGIPCEDSALIALRTQQILAYESGCTNTVDPLSGAYCIESLTDEIEENVWKYLDKINSIGGMVSAIEKGYPQREIADASYKYQKDIDSGIQKVIGVNIFRDSEDIKIKPMRVSNEIERVQREGVRSIKKNRGDITQLIKKLRSALHKNDNLVPVIIDCVKGRMSLGEICGVMREEFGEYRAEY